MCFDSFGGCSFGGVFDSFWACLGSFFMFECLCFGGLALFLSFLIRK